MKQPHELRVLSGCTLQGELRSKLGGPRFWTYSHEEVDFLSHVSDPKKPMVEDRVV